eukprot:1828392-Pyramimonas_sp.AAC.1
MARTAVLASTAQGSTSTPSLQDAVERLQTVVAGAPAALLAGNPQAMLQTLAEQLAQLQSAVQSQDPSQQPAQPPQQRQQQMQPAQQVQHVQQAPSPGGAPSRAAPGTPSTNGQEHPWTNLLNQQQAED